MYITKGKRLYLTFLFVGISFSISENMCFLSVSGTQLPCLVPLERWSNRPFLTLEPDATT